MIKISGKNDVINKYRFNRNVANVYTLNLLLFCGWRGK